MTVTMSKLLYLLICLLSVPQPSLSAYIANDIFILAGQSNMVGKGGVFRRRWDGYVPPQCTPKPPILRLSAQLKWEVAREPLHRDIDLSETCGIGLGIPFANELLKVDGSRIGAVGLVPCAIGGTRIGQWSPGRRLYRQLVSRATESVKSGGRIRAILWFQGESDTIRTRDAVTYKRKMERLIRNLRSDLNMPSLPIIQVVLASGLGKFTETVRGAQLSINLPNVKSIDAKGLPLEPDNVHLTAASQVQLGQKMAHAFLASFNH